MNNHAKKITGKKFISILTALLAIVITVLLSSYIIFNELETQLQQNLEDVATQNALALHFPSSVCWLRAPFVLFSECLAVPLPD